MPSRNRQRSRDRTSPWTRRSPSHGGRGILMNGSPSATVYEPTSESPPWPADAGRFLARRGARPRPRKPIWGHRARYGAGIWADGGQPFPGPTGCPARPRRGRLVGNLPSPSPVSDRHPVPSNGAITCTMELLGGTGTTLRMPEGVNTEERLWPGSPILSHLIGRGAYACEHDCNNECNYCQLRSQRQILRLRGDSCPRPHVRRLYRTRLNLTISTFPPNSSRAR
jgi:hypothetical protein